MSRSSCFGHRCWYIMIEEYLCICPLHAHLSLSCTLSWFCRRFYSNVNWLYACVDIGVWKSWVVSNWWYHDPTDIVSSCAYECNSGNLCLRGWSSQQSRQRRVACPFPIVQIEFSLYSCNSFKWLFHQMDPSILNPGRNQNNMIPKWV